MKELIVDIGWHGNYGASSEQVLGCVALHETLEGVKKGFKSALEFHLEGLEEDEIPEILKGEYRLVYKMNIHALLNHYRGVVTLVALANRTNIDKRQLGHYMQGRRKPRIKQENKIKEAFRQIGKELISVV